MTIVFGENGAGKTGYVRILKRVADVRTAEQILPDVRGVGGSPKLHALIKYAVGERDATPLVWDGTKGVHPLTRLDVFDAGAVDVHLDEDLTYVYTPSDIALFRHVHDALEAVKGKLDTARQSRAPKTNAFLAGFVRDTDVYPKIESLGATSDIGELRKLASATPEEEAGLPALRERVEALRSQTPETRATLLRTDRQLLQRVVDLATALSQFDAASYESTRQALLAASKRHEQASTTAFEGSGIPGMLGETWQAFVLAGEQYLHELAENDYPSADAPCIYCRQPLTDGAVVLLRKLREYCDGALKKDVEVCQNTFDATCRFILDIDVAALRSAVEARANLSPLTKTLVELLLAAEGLRSQISARAALVPYAEDVARFLSPAQEELAFEQTEIERLLGDLTAQAEARTKALAAEQARQRLLEARIHLRDHFAAIEAHVLSAKWAERAQPFVKSRIPQLQKALTEVSKTASERLLNHDFEKYFLAECDALKAPGVKLDFPGKKAQPARRKMLAGHRLSAVLSEGEQKALALADFLAEAALKGSSTPIVFDDPVTSLDYKRHLHVVKRLVEMSRERQVIVFTHNIWFTTELLSRFEKETERKHCSYYSVGGDGVGVISKGTHPRADTFSTMKGKLNSLLQDAAKLDGETLEAMVERGYGILRGICEVIVETDLFQGVVQRYQPNVRMTCLEQIAPDAFAATAKTLFDVFERACRVIEAHSQPMETLNVRPTLAELRIDWESVEKARQGYLDAVKKAA